MVYSILDKKYLFDLLIAIVITWSNLLKMFNYMLKHFWMILLVKLIDLLLRWNCFALQGTQLSEIKANMLISCYIKLFDLILLNTQMMLFHPHSCFYYFLYFIDFATQLICLQFLYQLLHPHDLTHLYKGHAYNLLRMVHLNLLLIN